jgi:predicted alpha-1,6-mannanase (GH76 family)
MNPYEVKNLSDYSSDEIFDLSLAISLAAERHKAAGLAVPDSFSKWEYRLKDAYLEARKNEIVESQLGI